jgi:hypothetical protein
VSVSVSVRTSHIHARTHTDTHTHCAQERRRRMDPLAISAAVRPSVRVLAPACAATPVEREQKATRPFSPGSYAALQRLVCGSNAASRGGGGAASRSQTSQHSLRSRLERRAGNLTVACRVAKSGCETPDLFLRRITRASSHTRKEACVRLQGNWVAACACMCVCVLCVYVCVVCVCVCVRAQQRISTRTSSSKPHPRFFAHVRTCDHLNCLFDGLESAQGHGDRDSLLVQLLWD